MRKSAYQFQTASRTRHIRFVESADAVVLPLATRSIISIPELEGVQVEATPKDSVKNTTAGEVDEKVRDAAGSRSKPGYLLISLCIPLFV